MKSLFALLMVVLLNSQAFAASDSGVLLGVGILKYDQETEGNQIGNSKSTNTYYDLKLGYLPGGGLYLGGIYSVHNQDNGSSDPKRTLYGATIGYHASGWYIDGSYFIDGKLERGTTEFKKASGIGIDIGYQAMMNTNFYIGVQGSYKSYTFKEYSNGGATVTEDNKVKSELYPMLTLGLIF